MKLKKYHKFLVAADGSAASGKTTGAKKIARKFGLKFLSSGLLYRYAGYQILKYKSKNKVKFLKKVFKKFNLKKLNNINLHSTKISEYTSIIAKEKKIRLVLKSFQKKFSSKFTPPDIKFGRGGMQELELLVQMGFLLSNLKYKWNKQKMKQNKHYKKYY